MRFVWLITLILAIIVAVSGDSCPSGFKKDGSLCTANRPIHGECPPKSRLDIGINKCVYVARG